MPVTEPTYASGRFREIPAGPGLAVEESSYHCLSRLTGEWTPRAVSWRRCSAWRVVVGVVAPGVGRRVDDRETDEAKVEGRIVGVAPVRHGRVESAGSVPIGERLPALADVVVASDSAVEEAPSASLIVTKTGNEPGTV